MGDVASPASGNANFGKELRSFFEQGDLGAGSGLGTGDRRKEARGATAHHYDPSRFHGNENISRANSRKTGKRRTDGEGAKDRGGTRPLRGQGCPRSGPENSLATAGFPVHFVA
jgi:hypothetical protein